MRLLLIIALMLTIASAAHAEADDDQLRAVLERAARYIDNPGAGRSEVRYAIQLASGETNRIVSLMKNLAASGSTRRGITGFYVAEIGKYGTPQDVSFLCQMLASTNHFATAVLSLFQIEGITTNSVSLVASALPRQGMANWRVDSAWIMFADEVREKCVDELARVMAVSNLIEYASLQNHSPERIDRSIRRLDSTYERSKRRLGVLRAVQNLGVNEWQTNFVATAIRELEAYPEANLPE